MEQDIKTEIKETKVIDLEKEVLGHTASFLIGAFVITLFLMLVMGGWYLASSNTLKKTETRIAEVDQSLASLKDVEEDMNAFGTAVDNISSAMSRKKQWLPVFRELSSDIPKDVILSNFSVDESNNAKIDASAPSLVSLAKTIVAFKQDKSDPKKENSVFKNVALSSFSFTANKITFSLSMEVKGAK